MRGLLDAFLPRRCAAWDLPIDDGVLCGPARETLVHAPVDEGVPQAAWLYGGALRDMVTRAKFGPDPSCAHALAELWQAALVAGEVSVPAHEAEAVTWVPAHWRRRQARGFDLPPLLAAAVGDFLGRPVVDLLVCARHLPPQSKAASVLARKESAEGRYRLRGRPPSRESSVLLVDDVVTTGATLAAAAAPLLAAGYRVVPVALCRTPGWNTVHDLDEKVATGTPSD